MFGVPGWLPMKVCVSVAPAAGEAWRSSSAATAASTTASKCGTRRSARVDVGCIRRVPSGGRGLGRRVAENGPFGPDDAALCQFRRSVNSRIAQHFRNERGGSCAPDGGDATNPPFRELWFLAASGETQGSARGTETLGAAAIPVRRDRVGRLRRHRVPGRRRARRPGVRHARPRGRSPRASAAHRVHVSERHRRAPAALRRVRPQPGRRAARDAGHQPLRGQHDADAAVRPPHRRVARGADPDRRRARDPVRGRGRPQPLAPQGGGPLLAVERGPHGRGDARAEGGLLPGGQPAPREPRPLVAGLLGLDELLPPEPAHRRVGHDGHLGRLARHLRSPPGVPVGQRVRRAARRLPAGGRGQPGRHRPGVGRGQHPHLRGRGLDHPGLPRPGGEPRRGPVRAGVERSPWRRRRSSARPGRPGASRG